MNNLYKLFFPFRAKFGVRFFVFSLSFFLIFSTFSFAGDIPQNINYTKIYDFLDELAIDGIIEINSVIKPYSREFIAQKLLEAKEKEELLNSRQNKDVDFYLNDYALELNQLPDTKVNFARTDNLTFALIQPAFHYHDELFRLRITPIVGAEFYVNKNDFVANRRIGAELQATVGKYFTVFGSLRDIAFQGERLARPSFLNQFPGAEYKETMRDSDGADYSDSRGGIKFSNNWMSVGLVKDQIMWGDNYHGSNIISGRAPSFPMITLQVKPVRWFQLDYFHGFLVSNVLDSTSYYLEETQGGKMEKRFRPANKFIAANMLTFTPIRNLNISIGNATIYSEPNVQPAYFIPIAFYKSIAHTQTKGTVAQNGNSAIFFNVSSRNIKHLHLYTSLFIDEIKFARFRSSHPENNPISFKIGGRLSNFPLQNVSLTGEYTRTNIIPFKHSIPVTTWESNSFNMGHYLVDNAQEIYVELGYKPIRGLDLSFSYMNAKKGNEYNYIRGDHREGIRRAIAQEVMKDIIWTNQTYSFKALYEVFNNCYAGINVIYSDIQGHDAKSEPIPSEVRLDAQGYLDRFTPNFFQGKNLTLNMMLTIGF